MNGFLVVIRCGMDDLPVRLFDDETAAAAYCLAVPEDDVAAIKRTLRIDTSDFHGVGVLQFSDGKPTGYRHVISFDEIDEADVPKWAVWEIEKGAER